jgi:hypothetical protein
MATSSSMPSSSSGISVTEPPLRGIAVAAAQAAPGQQEALQMTGLTAEEFRGRSFVKIMKGRT